MWGFLSGLASGIGSWFGAKSASEGAEDTNAKQIELANRQMDFQKEMSSTAHQREVQDLLAAGLNPILSVNSGAPMAMGAMPVMANAKEAYAKAGSDFGGSVSSMFTNAKAIAESKFIRATTSKAVADASAAASNAKIAANDAEISTIKTNLKKSNPSLLQAEVVGDAFNAKNLPGVGVAGVASSAKQIWDRIKSFSPLYWLSRAVRSH